MTRSCWRTGWLAGDERVGISTTTAMPMYMFDSRSVPVLKTRNYPDLLNFYFFLSHISAISRRASRARHVES